MSDYIVQLKDDLGNKQYPVTLAQCIIDDDGTVIGEKLDVLEGMLTNLKTVGGESIVGENSGENIPFKTINVDGTPHDVVGSGTINITTSQNIDIKSLKDSEGEYPLLGSGEVEFKTINGQSLFGSGEVDLSNLIVDSTGIEYRPLLFEDDNVPEGYDSYTAYNAETYTLLSEGKATPVFEELALPDAITLMGSDIFIAYTIYADAVKTTVIVELSSNGSISANSDNIFDSKFVDANSLVFYLDNTIGNTLNVDEAAVLSYISWCNIVHTARNRQENPLNLPEPIAYVTSSSDPTVSCIVNSTAVVGTGEGLIVEYDFGESRYRRTYTINGSNAIYEEEEISLGGGADEEVYIGPEQPDNLSVNLWVDTDEEEIENGVIIGGDGYLGDILIDAEMSDTSVNAVQNRAIKNYIDTKLSEALGNISDLLDEINGDI